CLLIIDSSICHFVIMLLLFARRLPHRSHLSFPTRRSSVLLVMAGSPGDVAAPEPVHGGRQRPAGAAGDLHVVAAHEAAREVGIKSEEHTSELQSRENLVCRLLLE